MKSLAILLVLTICLGSIESADADTPTTNSATVTFDGVTGQAIMTWDFGTHSARDSCIVKTDFHVIPDNIDPVDALDADVVGKVFLGDNTNSLYDLSGITFETIFNDAGKLTESTIPCTGSMTFDIPSGYHYDDIQLFMTFGEIINSSDVATHSGSYLDMDTIDEEFDSTTIKVNTLHEITIQYTNYIEFAPLQCGGANAWELGTEYFKDKYFPDTIITLDVKNVCDQNADGESTNPDGTSGNDHETKTTANGAFPTTGDYYLVFPSPTPEPEPTPETKKNGGGGCSGDCTPPTFGKDKDGRQIVEGGFSFDGNVTDVTKFWTPYKEITANTNTTHNFTFKAYDDNGINNIKWVQFGIVPEVGTPLNNAEVLATIYIHSSQIEKIVEIDKNNLWDIINATLYSEECGYVESDCLELSLDVIFREELKNKVIVIEVMDNSQNTDTKFLNDGINTVGESMNEPLISYVSASKGGAFYPQDRGLVELTLTSYKNNEWQDVYNYMWEYDYTNKTFRITDTMPVPLKEPDLMWKAMTRRNSSFPAKIIYEQEKAVLIFDSTKLISELEDSWTYNAPKTAEEKQAELDIKIQNEIDRITPLTKDYTKNQYLYQKNSYNHWNYFSDMTLAQINQMNLEKKLQLQDELFQQRIAEQQKYQS